MNISIWSFQNKIIFISFFLFTLKTYIIWNITPRKLISVLACIFFFACCQMKMKENLGKYKHWYEFFAYINCSTIQQNNFAHSHLPAKFDTKYVYAFFLLLHVIWLIQRSIRVFTCDLLSMIFVFLFTSSKYNSM